MDTGGRDGQHFAGSQRADVIRPYREAAGGSTPRHFAGPGRAFDHGGGGIFIGPYGVDGLSFGVADGGCINAAIPATGIVR